MNIKHFSFLTLLIAAFLPAISHAEETTTPDVFIYEGRLLHPDRDPYTDTLVFRFSLWGDANWMSTSQNVDGSINSSANGYGEWSETQVVTPTSNGHVSIKLGSNTDLPKIEYDKHRYLQIETKSIGASDTTYVLLDPTGDSGADTRDRKLIGSMLYAKNSETVGHKKVGTGPGDIAFLSAKGRIIPSNMGNGTDLTSFVINTEGRGGSNPTLVFKSTEGEQSISYNTEEDQFECSTDLHTNGDLSADGDVTIASLPSCDSLKTNGDGTIVCGTNRAAPTVYVNLDQKVKNALGWDGVMGALSSFKNHFLFRTYEGVLPPYECGSSVSGMQWVDSDTGLLYICDANHNRNAWLSPQDTPLTFEEGESVGYIAPKAMTVTGYHFTHTGDTCADGSYDLELWSRSSSNQAYAYKATLVASQTTTSSQTDALAVHIWKGEHIIWKVKDSCKNSVNRANLTLFSRWRHP